MLSVYFKLYCEDGLFEMHHPTLIGVLRHKKRDNSYKQSFKQKQNAQVIEIITN